MSKEQLLESGRALCGRARFLEALGSFESALELDQSYADAWYGMAD